MHDVTRFIVDFGEALRESGLTAARALLPDPAKVHERFAPTFRALQAIADGSRDPTLADDPVHHATVAVELALLLESLPPAGELLSLSEPSQPVPAPADSCPCGSGIPFAQCHGAGA
jgi:hypothetical protein